MNLRGLAPSFGAGGSLVGAVVVAAVALSGVLAFDGWPGDGADPASGSVPLAAAPAPLRALGGGTVAAPSGSAVPVSPPAARRARAGPRAVARRAPAPAPVAAPAPAVQPTAPAAPAASPPPRRDTTPRPVVPVQPPVQLPADPVGTASVVVDTVQHAIPPLPQPVQPVVDTVNGLVDGLQP
jgi:hypothetical protein